jgi:hypothetical protein
LVIILAMTMVAVLAPASMAGKGGAQGPPDGGGDDPGNLFSVSVGLFDAHEPRAPYMWEGADDPGFPFHWISKAGDTIVVRVVIDPSPAASGTEVTLCDTMGIFSDCGTPLTMTLADAPMIVDSAPHTVLETELDEVVDKRGNVSGSFTFTLTVAGGGSTETVVTEVPWYSDVPCVPNEDGSYTIDGLCIWEPRQFGVWDIEIVEAFGRTGKSNRLPGVTVRDHVPGNWCLLPDANYFAGHVEWGFLDGWSADGLTRTVYLPTGNLAGEHPGVCLKEGAADRNTMGVGNPDSFYVATNARLIFTWVGPHPPQG